MILLRNLSNVRRKLEMLLISCEISLILTWSENCFLFEDITDQEPLFTIPATKLYVQL